MLVAERDVVVDEIANRLDPRPARRRLLEQLPCDIGKPVGLAVAAAEQIDDGLRRQILDRMLRGRRHDHIGQTAVAHRAVGGKAHPAGRRDDPAAPVAEAVAIGRDGHGRTGGEIIGHDDIGGAREMRAQHRDQRRRLRKVVDHLVADANFHANTLTPIVCSIQKSARRHWCGSRADSVAERMASLQPGHASNSHGNFSLNCSGALRRWRRKWPNTSQGAVYSADRVGLREKAIANRAKRAHDQNMHNKRVGAAAVREGHPA